MNSRAESEASTPMSSNGSGTVIPCRPILRLPASLPFESVPPALRDQICRTLSIADWREDHFDIHLIHEDENNRHHYQSRIKALAEGATFFLKARFFNAFNFVDELINHINAMTEDCIKHLTTLPTDNIQLLQSILARYTDELTTVLAKELDQDQASIKEYLSYAEELALALNTKPALCTITNLQTNVREFIATIDQPLNPFTHPELMQEFKRIKNKDKHHVPRWFSELTTYQQHIIHYFFSLIDIDRDLGTRVNSISSKFRLMPIPSNYGIHTLITYLKCLGEEQPTLTVHTPEIRSAHAASRDIKHLPSRIAHLHTTRNLLTELEEVIQRKQAEISSDQALQENVDVRRIMIPVLYQTLITPLLDPDAFLQTQRLKAMEALCYELQQKKYMAGNIELIFDFVMTNHALNYGKYVCLTTPNSVSGKEITWLLQELSTHLREPRDPKLSTLLSLVKAELNTHLQSYSSLFSDYRELYFASLEQLGIAAWGGVSIGSCVSGKDRKAIEIIHTDAMKIFFEKYRTLPPMYCVNETEENAMQEFARIFAELFCNKHQQAAASSNAPGAFGTKTPWIYLPKHLRDAIHTWYEERDVAHSVYAELSTRDTLAESDRLATNNEIEKITAGKVPSNLQPYLWKPTFSEHQLTCQLNVADVIQRTLDAIGNENRDGYLSTRHQTLNFLSRNFDSDRGRLRALAYQQLLADDLPELNKLIIIQALLSSPDGITLQNHVATAIGFSNLDTAKNAIHQTILNLASLSEEKLQPTLETIYTVLNTLTQSAHINPGIHHVITTLDNLCRPQPYLARF